MLHSTIDLDQSIAEVLGRLAGERPDAVAIEDGERRLTYGELDDAAARIAAGLHAAGLEDEEPVAVCLPRSWQAICAFLGVLRAGAAYVPIDPDYPAERQCELLSLARARTVLTGPGHGTGLPAGLRQLDAGAIAADVDGPIYRGPPAGGDRLAYVLFTSGSTGRPKGVEVTHRNLVHVLRSGADIVARPDDVVLHVVPLGFDLSAQEIWGALLNGARLIVAPRGRPDPAELGRRIAARGVTLLTISTGLFHELVRGALPDLGGLRLISAGGDVLSPSVAAELRAAHPSVRLLNSYGPTEATILASTFEVDEVDGSPLPIGKPLPGYRLEVRDETGAPLPDGATGELWIGGEGVARGYRGDPERTAAAFPTDPARGDRMYRTGDRVRWRADGELLFLGRIDDQVKIDGYRVEPGEVEHALASHPELREAVVVAREDVPGHKRLVGYAVPRGDESPSPQELRAYLAHKLPAFMVPATIVPLDAPPLNERGKVDRAALPDPRGERGEDASAENGLDPIAALMAEILGLDSVRPGEDFFELGGTSLLAIQLVGRLRERLDANVDVGAVFEAPTPLALAERIAAATGRRPALPPLLPGRREPTAPLSAAQRRAWLFGRLHPDSIAYQFAAIFRLQGALDVDALEGALADLLQRHEILRTDFHERDGEPFQRIRPSVEHRLDRVDLRGASSDAWRRLARQRVRTRVDPGEAPLVHWTLARLGERSWRLIHVEHHLVHDGWSFAVLAGDLAELYSARVEAREPRLPHPAVQFQDYAHWERRAHASPTVRAQVERWAGRLDPDPPPIELPGAQPRPARESFAGGAVRRRLGAELVGRLRALAVANRVTLYMLTLAAFVVQLGRYAGRDDLQLGTGLANRHDPNAEQLIGMLVNTVALRFDLSGDPSVAELLARVRAVALEAYADADAPFDAVVEELRPPRYTDRSPLVQALFSFHDAPRSAQGWSGLDLHLLQGIPNGTAKADLNVIGIPADEGGLTFVWEHSDLLDAAAADRLAGHHLQLLEQFVARPEARLSELELLTEGERRRIEEVSTNREPFDRGSTIHGLVEAQAQHEPGATAVIDGSRRLSYRELLDRAVAVAGALRGRGVSPGDPVGVLLGRSAESVAAQLGVLGGGGAYVPLDPQHPPARIARVLADAGIAVVLTDAELRRRLPIGIAALEIAEALRTEHRAEPHSPSPDDLAYVIYTSGSTGEPKGVEVTHRNVVRLVDDPDYADLGPGTAMLHAASPAFDAATLETWGPLANGGMIVCLNEQPSPDAIAAAIGRHGVTTLWLTAGLFHELVDRRPDCLAGVRQLLAGGDVLSPDHVRRALAALPADGRLTNGYGPTETTTFACTHDLRPGDPVDGPVPIGRPVQGTSCRVLDPSGHEAPVRMAGELAIGGDGVARGYRGDRELTAARFRPDPHRPGERRYLTGDRVRRRADGTIEFLGRTDRQLKLRGVRVEPAEVEEALRIHPAVGDAAVVPFELPRGDRALAAYVVPTDGTAPGAAVLRAHALARLPAAMVPTAWIALPRLPLTVNGKLDREHLPAPENRHLVRGRTAARPSGELERRVVACFEEVLGVRGVGAEDDFFALGGHSLLAISLFAALEDLGRRRLPLATIFEAPTPSALAARLGPNAPGAGWDNLVALKPRGTRPPLFVIAAGDGNIVGFGPLARQLSAEQPLYALQPNGLDGRRPLDEGIEAMAARYLTALRGVQSHGPYLLAGRCNGATVAYEMAQRLRAAGEDVPLLAALDSDPPPAGPRELAPGIPYDPMMESAWKRALDAGEDVPDLEEPEGFVHLADWLATPVGPGVSRYLHEAWRWRDDLCRAWPDPLGAHARALAEWGWDHGPRELGLPRALLLLRAPGEQPPGERLRRARALGSRLARERATETRRQGVDLLERWLDRPLPEARERIERRVVAAARRARESYRAEPWPGRVLLVTSPEFERKPTYPAWELRARGGVERKRLPVGHVEMLREPGAALLAACLEEAIVEALRR